MKKKLTFFNLLRNQETNLVILNDILVYKGFLVLVTCFQENEKIFLLKFFISLNL